MEVRKFPAVDQRVETGAIQFGDDWPGIFIRGDNALHYAMQLESLLTAHGQRYTDPIAVAVIRGLFSDLRTCNVSAEGAGESR